MKGPKGKHIFGTVKVGERGQIVIPKEARDVFGIKPGDTLLMLGDEEQGIAIVKNELLRHFAESVLRAPMIPNMSGEDEEDESGQKIDESEKEKKQHERD